MNKPHELKSTRLSIVEQSIADIVERLDQLPPSERSKELRAKARIYERAIDAWPAAPPTDEQRSKMMGSVIELHVEVMHLSATSNS